MKRFLNALVMSVANLAGLLLGWGEWSSYWSDPARTLVGVVLFGAPLGVAALAPNADTGRSEDVAGQKRTVVILIMVMMPIGYALASHCLHHELFTWAPSPAIQWTGIALFASGWLVVFAAVGRLRRHYSVFVTVQPGHELVQTGVYRRVRHPIYLGFMVWVLGFALVFRAWVTVLFWILVTIGAWKKMSDEERFMRSRFPEYGEYAKRSWRLVPYVY